MNPFKLMMSPIHQTPRCLFPAFPSFFRGCDFRSSIPFFFFYFKLIKNEIGHNVTASWTRLASNSFFNAAIGPVEANLDLNRQQYWASLSPFVTPLHHLSDIFRRQKYPNGAGKSSFTCPFKYWIQDLLCIPFRQTWPPADFQVD